MRSLQKKLNALFTFLLILFGIAACNEYILEPVIVFEVSLDQKRLQNDQQISLTLHSFNMEVSSLEVILLKVDQLNIDDFTVIKQENFNRIVLEFSLPDSSSSFQKILVGVDRPYHQAGYVLYQRP